MKMNLINDILDLHFLTKDPVCFVGPAGIGKTQAVHAFGAAKGVKVFEYRLAYSEPGDIRGLPIAMENGVMKFTRPEDLPSLEDENCIIFLDEINRATIPMQNGVMQMTDGSGRVGTHILPKGCLVVAAMNPDNANYMVNALDQALVSRFSMVPVDYDRNVLLSYARDKNWHPKVLGFIAMEANLFSSGDFDGETNTATPRSLERLSRAEHAGLSNKNDVHKITAIGLLGPKIGVEYYNYATGEQPITFDELIHDKDILKRVKKLSDPLAMRSDLLGITNTSIALYYSGFSGEKVDAKVQARIVAYLEIIPADLAVGLLKTIFLSRPEMVDTFQAEDRLMTHLGERLKSA